jgi:nucleoside 2-deoxyribosyltransferase
MEEENKIKKPVIYIAGPIKSDPNYRERFADAEKRILAYGWLALNPARLDFAWKNLPPEDAFDIDLAMLDKADGIYMLDGWEQSCGANREYGYALASDKMIFRETERVFVEKAV